MRGKRAQNKKAISKPALQSFSGRVLLVTNINTHYRDGFFRELRQRLDIDFLFFSDGGERYWSGPISPVDHLGASYLKGIWVGRTRLVPRLILELARRDYDVVIKCINGKFALPLTWAIAKLRRKPFILWTGVWRHPEGALHRWFRPLVRGIYQHSDAIVTYGTHVSRHLVDEGVQPQRLVEALQAVDNEQYKPSAELDQHALRRELALPPDACVLLFVGRLEAEKGVHTLLDALALLHKPLEHVMVIAGAGSQEHAMVSQAKRLGVHSQLRFLGRIDNRVMRKLYFSADVLILPSETSGSGSEPWGLVLNEAMAARLCVVASDAVGAVQHGLVRPGDTGEVFAARDASGLATSLQRILDDPTLRKRMAASGQREIADYTFRRMADGFVAAIRFTHQTRAKRASSNVQEELRELQAHRLNQDVP